MRLFRINLWVLGFFLALFMGFMSEPLWAQGNVKKTPYKLMEASLKWEGYKKVGEKHYGEISVLTNETKIYSYKKEGVSTRGHFSGLFVIDMTSITVKDLTKERSRMRLENHLKNEDFFEVDTYPKATFLLLETIPMPGDRLSSMNQMLTKKGKVVAGGFDVKEKYAYLMNNPLYEAYVSMTNIKDILAMKKNMSISPYRQDQTGDVLFPETLDVMTHMEIQKAYLDLFVDAEKNPDKYRNKYLLRGVMTIKGIPKGVVIPVSITEQKGVYYQVDMSFYIDRTDFNVQYGSGKFFASLGDKVIEDNFKMDIALRIEPQ